jgi:hypothetical protein
VCPVHRLHERVRHVTGYLCAHDGPDDRGEAEVHSAENPGVLDLPHRRRERGEGPLHPGKSGRRHRERGVVSVERGEYRGRRVADAGVAGRVLLEGWSRQQRRPRGVAGGADGGDWTPPVVGVLGVPDRCPPVLVAERSPSGRGRSRWRAGPRPGSIWRSGVRPPEGGRLSLLRRAHGAVRAAVPPPCGRSSWSSAPLFSATCSGCRTMAVTTKKEPMTTLLPHRPRRH